ncbi:MAG: 4-hydroxy-tetrahydrodipicolinate reductase [Candidatus Omnitrophica bacterium]|nr:4-hydroxy-tetrahydrodipicolinate reductase [Candidatus Omnitrophota bacterium]
MRIGVIGAGGKMGKMISKQLLDDPEVSGVVCLERENAPEIGKDISGVIGLSENKGIKVSCDVEEACKTMDCLIDFTLPGPTLDHVDICLDNDVPMVIGTTGFIPEGEKAIVSAAEIIPIVFSPNMAIGVNVLFKIVSDAARILSNEFSIKIDETHHVHKKDSPSGTAKMIAKKIKEASGIDAPIEAFREGEVVGNHGIIFDGKYENIVIRHDAKSRDVFALGAIKAAKFVIGKKPGLYSMADVLGL